MNIFELTRILNEAKRGVSDSAKKTISSVNTFDKIAKNETDKIKTLSKVNNYIQGEIEDEKERTQLINYIFSSGFVPKDNNNIKAIIKDIISDLSDEDISFLVKGGNLDDLIKNKSSDELMIINHSSGIKRLSSYERYGIGKFELLFAIFYKGKKSSKGGDVEVNGITFEIKTKGGSIKYEGEEDNYFDRFNYLVFYNDNGIAFCESSKEHELETHEELIQRLGNRFKINQGKGKDARSNRTKIVGVNNF